MVYIIAAKMRPQNRQNETFYLRARMVPKLRLDFQFKHALDQADGVAEKPPLGSRLFIEAIVSGGSSNSLYQGKG
jgi:hypothetical protein